MLQQRIAQLCILQRRTID
ncbi:hypothetical protein Gogos_003878 [Gossypium gossypioides]|uniref:Uncharacterized protein n=1 Tax=Gossypium gossypioides TaxID=34282 RepID=A0A7J9CNC1_GOSGO|nr:hypothetical protein [Gossypium gossypioides]